MEIGTAVVPSWRIAFRLAWVGILNRRGRSALTAAATAILVSFLMSILVSQSLLGIALESGDLHVRAVLDRAGLGATDPETAERERERKYWILFVSSLLAAVGIADTMLLGVTDRYREIGTLKCLGAHERFVLRMFLAEGLLVGLAGGAVGTAAGAALGVLQFVLRFEAGLLPSSVVFVTAARYAPVAFGFGAALTVLAAVYPARYGSRLSPVVALRADL